jgi:hypothetical protein
MRQDPEHRCAADADLSCILRRSYTSRLELTDLLSLHPWRAPPPVLLLNYGKPAHCQKWQGPLAQRAVRHSFRWRLAHAKINKDAAIETHATSMKRAWPASSARTAPTAAINKATPATTSATQLKVLLICTPPFLVVRAGRAYLTTHLGFEAGRFTLATLAGAFRHR